LKLLGVSYRRRVDRSAIPSWIVKRIANLDSNSIELNHGPVAECFERLPHENTAKARVVHVGADQVADARRSIEFIQPRTVFRLENGRAKIGKWPKNVR
jgi:hypothetical protein